MQVKIKLLDKECMPAKAHFDDAAYDLKSRIDIAIKPHCVVPVPLGFQVALPTGAGWVGELQIRPRSGLALKARVFIANSPGTVDAGYRNEVMALVENCGDSILLVKKHDRIAQGVFTKVERAMLEEVEELDDTERGLGGFGSTGV